MRKLKVFIPVTILVVAYAAVLVAMIVSMSAPDASKAGSTPSGPSAGQSDPTSPNGRPSPNGPAVTQSPGSTRGPNGETDAPGTGSEAGSGSGTTPDASGSGGLAPGETRAPGSSSSTTRAPGGSSGTTKAPGTGTTTKAPGAGTPAPGTPGTTKAPGTPSTTKAPGTPGTTKAPGTPSTTKAPSAPGTKAPAPQSTTVITDPEWAPLPPEELGSERGFCFRNSCDHSIWVGQIGGAVGVSCAGGCPAGTKCNELPELGCYFSLNFPTNKIALKPNELYCMPFGFDPVTTTVHMPTGDIHLVVQWSGAIYASSGCDANMNCETAVCKDCPPWRGPVGPVAQGEITLSAIWKDYYDTTLIHGANLPLAMKPVSLTGSFFPDEWAPWEYHCKSPGINVDYGKAYGATWRFDVAPPGEDMSVVPLVVSGSLKPCTRLSDCKTAGEVCGHKMTLTADNKPTPELTANICGKPGGVWSRSELCGWTDSWSFGNCKNMVPGGTDTIQHLYKCAGDNAESCFQKIADENCCGCATWDDFIPVHGEDCHHHNPLWEKYVMPNLRIIKTACPMCYTYPYDDSTALFTCWNDNVWNDVSYEFEWCPGGTKMTFYDSRDSS